MQYRKEIDGIRSLAVMSVIFFHAGIPFFHGGFVGVDIFFVISGYLITSIIKEEIHAGKFSLLDFYERRARRILPALFLVMFVCLPAAWFILIPADWAEFSMSVSHVPLFLSNVLFSKQSGYFDVAAELKPLLHTWSLAVEEQYYLFFPLILLTCWRTGRRGILVVLSLLAIGSLLYAQYKLQSKPSSAFYLLPSRFWELLIGALLAFKKAEHPPSGVHLLIQRIGSFTGLLLMGYAIVAFDQQTPFPGIYAFIPTAGAALTIYFANSNNAVGRLLGTRVLVGIGLISYSAYLWHQPIFSLYRHWTLRELEPAAQLLLILLTLALAYVTWRFVESPFRSKSRFSQRTIFRLAIGGSLTLIGIGLLGQRTENYSRHLTPGQNEFLTHFDNSLPDWRYFTSTGMLREFRTQCDFYNMARYRQGAATKTPVDSIASECFERVPGKKHVLLIWGDSHAQQLYPGLKRTLPANWQILQVTSSGCAPAIHTEPDKSDYCRYSNWFAYQTIRSTQPDVILLGQNMQHEASAMMALAKEIRTFSKSPIIYAGPSPHWVADLPKIVVRHMWPEPARHSLIGLDKKLLANDQRLKATLSSSNLIHYVSLMDYFCNNNGCLIYTGNSPKDGLTSWDKGHLTPTASFILSRDILTVKIQALVQH